MNPSSKRALLGLIAVFTGLCCNPLLAATPFPTKPILILVSYPAGGALDV